MILMALDCEYNQPSGKTIQIGACAFDSGTGEILDRIRIQVDPGEPILDRITELTGIRDQDVAGAGGIQAGFQKLREFHEKNHCFINPVVWGSGDRTDSGMIFAESGEPATFMGHRVLDAKTLYQGYCIANRFRTKGGLKQACGKMSLEFLGTEHTALDDAINTARIFIALNRRFVENI